MWSHQPIRRCPILRWGEVADKRSCDQRLWEWGLVVTSYYPRTRQPGQVNCVCCGRLMFPSCTKQELPPLGQKHYQMWRAVWCGGCVRNWLISDTPVGRRVAKAEANPTAFEGPSYGWSYNVISCLRSAAEAQRCDHTHTAFSSVWTSVGKVYFMEHYVIIVLTYIPYIFYKFTDGRARLCLILLQFQLVSFSCYTISPLFL